jgi:hypothetical protein
MRKKMPWIIAEWEKNSREMIRVGIDSYRGKTLISIRTWYFDDEKKLKPGKQGATYELKHLKKISKALKQANIQVRKNGLI